MAFSSIIGHYEVIENLKQKIRDNRLHHSIMLYGPPGIGKRTLATEFIKAINCKNFSDEPCEKCNNCKWISENKHPDVVIITNSIRATSINIKLVQKKGGLDSDGEIMEESGLSSKREITIDQIRYLDEVIYTKPLEGKYRVIFIIDAENLNKSAANAFLKTLEEPPENVIIVMTCSYLGMIPLTIRSRTEKIRLKPLSDIEMKRLLSERLNFSTGYPDIILRLLKGSLDKRILSIDDDSLREYLDIATQFINTERISIKEVLDIALVITQGTSREEREDRIYIFFSILKELLMDIYLKKDIKIWGKLSGLKGKITIDMIEDLSRTIKFLKTAQNLYCNQTITIKSELLRLTERWNRLSV